MGRTPTGATVLKRRQLRAAGWLLLPVPYWEWQALQHTDPAVLRQRRCEHLSRALAYALPLPAFAQPRDAFLRGAGAKAKAGAEERPGHRPLFNLALLAYGTQATVACASLALITLLR